MLRKYYKVKLMTIDTNQEGKEFKNNDMLDILLNANLKQVDEIIVYRTFSGVFKEVITNQKIPVIVEEIVPYSNLHSYDLIIHRPLFFMCNTSIEKDATRKYPTLESLEATESDVRDYLYNYIENNDNNMLLKERELDSLFKKADNSLKKVLKENGLEKNKVKRKDRKIIKSIINKYNI